MRWAYPLMFVLCLPISPGRAASPEEDYLALRDKALSQIKAMEKAKASEQKLSAEHEKLRDDLEKRLRLVLGDVSVAGFPGPGKLNLESLSDQDVGYGMLDALTYSGGAEGGPLLVVTTRSLLNKWLAARSREKLPELNVPADLATALGQDNFFTFAIGDDAAFTRNADLELTAPSGVELIRGMLGGWGQDIGPNPDLMLVVTLIKGDKVFIASERPKTTIGKIDACEAIWTQAIEKADKLRADYEAAHSKDEDEFDADARAQEQGDKDFHVCWRERAAKQPFYPALVKEAQDFANRIAGK